LQLTRDGVGMAVSTRAVDTFGLGFLGSFVGSERSQFRRVGRSGASGGCLAWELVPAGGGPPSCHACCVLRPAGRRKAGGGGELFDPCFATSAVCLGWPSRLSRCVKKPVSLAGAASNCATLCWPVQWRRCILIMRIAAARRLAHGAIPSKNQTPTPRPVCSLIGRG
jgi:hypothetical protein